MDIKKIYLFLILVLFTAATVYTAHLANKLTISLNLRTFSGKFSDQVEYSLWHENANYLNSQKINPSLGFGWQCTLNLNNTLTVYSGFSILNAEFDNEITLTIPNPWVLNAAQCQSWQLDPLNCHLKTLDAGLQYNVIKLAKFTGYIRGGLSAFFVSLAVFDHFQLTYREADGLILNTIDFKDYSTCCLGMHTALGGSAYVFRNCKLETGVIYYYGKIIKNVRENTPYQSEVSMDINTFSPFVSIGFSFF
jgi:hypothetical protein